MLSNMLNATSLPLLEQVVDFTQSRHGILAGNIANLDTPGYQSRDLDTVGFAEQLKNFAAAQSAGESVSQSGDWSELRRPSAEQPDMDWGHLTRHDEGDVNLEHQIARISKNQMEHNLALTIMTSQTRLLQAAISERA